MSCRLASSFVERVFYIRVLGLYNTQRREYRSATIPASTAS
jgi:hypothetical protein